MNLLVSPTEPPIIKTLGQSSSTPEKYGVDIYDEATNSGIQRKEFKDLLASLRDGRISKELLQMSDLDYGMWIIEGKPRWTNDGKMIGRYQNMTKQGWQGIQWSIMARGFFVGESKDQYETLEKAKDWFTWIAKPTHDSLVGRKGKIQVESKWGKVTKEDHQVHLLTSINGIGPGVARRIVQEVGLPFRLDVDKVLQIHKVKGIGKGRVEMIERLFE